MSELELLCFCGRKATETVKNDGVDVVCCDDPRCITTAESIADALYRGSEELVSLNPIGGGTHEVE